jgi:hypothetical protein
MGGQILKNWGLPIYQESKSSRRLKYSPRLTMWVLIPEINQTPVTLTPFQSIKVNNAPIRMDHIQFSPPS